MVCILLISEDKVKPSPSIMVAMEQHLGKVCIVTLSMTFCTGLVQSEPGSQRQLSFKVTTIDRLYCVMQSQLKT